MHVALQLYAENKLHLQYKQILHLHMYLSSSHWANYSQNRRIL